MLIAQSSQILSLSLSLSLYPSLLANLIDCIKCLYRAYVYKFLLISQLCCVLVHKRMSLMSASLFLQQCPVYLVHLIWMVCEMGIKWPYSCCFLSAASKICSKQHAASLCNSYLAFSLVFLSESRWYIHTVVQMWLQLGKNPILFYQRPDFHLINDLSVLSLWVCWHCFQ